MRAKPIIAISCGDPAGIGAEIAIKTVINKKVRDICYPVITGARSVLQEAIDTFSINKELTRFDESLVETDKIVYEDFSCLAINNFPKGQAAAECGELAYQTIVKTTNAVKLGMFDAIVTAPVSKESINLAGYPFQGHTELISQLCQCDNFVMMQSSDLLNVAFMSNHISLAEAKNFITQERFCQVARLFHNALNSSLGRSPKIAVAGFNPHAGENGYIGSEEKEIIIPAMQSLANKIILSGPFPADTLFIENIRNGFDGIICMYHDQGHIPFKMLSFDKGVNCTLGLPIIRTSVDHGTAFDIAWQGKAFTLSLECAIVKSVEMFYKKNA